MLGDKMFQVGATPEGAARLPQGAYYYGTDILIGNCRIVMGSPPNMRYAYVSMQRPAKSID
jgi:hypothetical protein